MKNLVMQIDSVENNGKGLFYVGQPNTYLAQLDYHIEPGKMIIDHTEVDKSLQGKNVGFALVERAVEYARENHLQVVPLCVFAHKVLQNHRELQDVL